MEIRVNMISSKGKVLCHIKWRGDGGFPPKRKKNIYQRYMIEDDVDVVINAGCENVQ